MRWLLGLALLASLSAHAARFALDRSDAAAANPQDARFDVRATARLEPGRAKASDARFAIDSTTGACALGDAIFSDGFE